MPPPIPLQEHDLFFLLSLPLKWSRRPLNEEAGVATPCLISTALVSSATVDINSHLQAFCHVFLSTVLETGSLLETSMNSFKTLLKIHFFNEAFPSPQLILSILLSFSYSNQTTLYQFVSLLNVLWFRAKSMFIK